MSGVPDAVDVGLSLLSGLLRDVPGFGGVLRLFDKWETDARVGKVEADVQRLLEKIGRDGRSLDAYVREAIRIALATGSTDAPQLRKADSCLVMLRELNTRSKLGLEWDPDLKRDAAVALIRSLLNPADPISELRAVVSELKRSDLILVNSDANAPAELPWEAIGPSREFFCRTDRMFQSWNPEEDAKEICRHSKAERRFDASQLEALLGWGPRRFNSAAVHAQLRRWIEVPYRSAHHPKYVLPWAYLTEEGEFFVDP